MRHSTWYIFAFAAATCLVCSILVSSSAVLLRPLQHRNEVLFKRKNVLMAAGLASPDESLSAAEVESRFSAITPTVLDMRSGTPAEGVDAANFDVAEQPMLQVPPNKAKVAGLPEQSLVYQVMKDGDVAMIILPVEGKGLWSTLYGFLALDAQTFKIQGLTFYQHGETPGLGGEIDNPGWKALWRGKTAFDEDMNPIIEVVKGKAAEPYEVDGLSGATMTSRGVSNLVRFWLGENGYGPYLKTLEAARKG